MKSVSLMMVLVSMALVGCGQGPMGPAGPAGAQGDQGVQGDQGEPGQDAPAPVSFEGYYSLPDGGWADVYEDAQGTVNIRSMRLIVKNADNSPALIPVSSVGQTAPANGTVFNRQTITYVPASHNLKKDSDNSLLSGAMLTELRLSMNDGKLVIKVIVSGPFSVAYLGEVTSL
jgi:hypothetical protein